MKIGFIGAGKAGTALGGYLKKNGVEISGYYSRSYESALAGADFTETRAYKNVEDLVEDSDFLILSVPDGQIESVWKQLIRLPIANKIISHLSGLTSSHIFSDRDRYPVYSYSIHPLIAINDKYDSVKAFEQAVFTIEGDSERLDDVVALFESLGNRVARITADKKPLYHTTAAMASNLYVGLISLCEQQLVECGFTEEDAHSALMPLVLNNAANISRVGAVEALTGPVERNDIGTVKCHIDSLSGNARDIYKYLSRQVIEVAAKKHPDRDYCHMSKMIEK